MAGLPDLCAQGRPHLADPYWTLHTVAQLNVTDMERPVQYLPGKEQLERKRARAALLANEEMTAFFHRTRRLPFVILRFAHTQDAGELLDSPLALNATIALGPDDAVSFDAAVDLLHVHTRLPVVRANMPGPSVNYVTSNTLARELLGFRPRWNFAAIVEDAVRVRA